MMGGAKKGETSQFAVKVLDVDDAVTDWVTEWLSARVFECLSVFVIHSSCMVTYTFDNNWNSVVAFVRIILAFCLFFFSFLYISIYLYYFFVFSASSLDLCMYTFFWLYSLSCCCSCRLAGLRKNIQKSKKSSIYRKQKQKANVAASDLYFVFILDLLLLF